MRQKRALITISTFFLVGILVSLFSLTLEQRREEAGYFSRIDNYFSSVEASINKMIKMNTNINISSNGTALRIGQGLPAKDFSSINSYFISFLNNLSESDAAINVTLVRGEFPLEVYPHGIVYKNPDLEKIEVFYNQNLTKYHVDIRVSDNIQNCQWNNFVAGTFPVEIRAEGHNKVCETAASVSLGTLAQYQIRVESNLKDIYVNFSNTILITKQTEVPQTNVTTTFILREKPTLLFQSDRINVTMKRFNVTKTDYPRIYENL